MEKKITAVEYFFDILEEKILDEKQVMQILETRNKALEMEKEQIIDAYGQGFLESDILDTGAEKYYNETFKK